MTKIASAILASMAALASPCVASAASLTIDGRKVEIANPAGRIETVHTLPGVVTTVSFLEPTDSFAKITEVALGSGNFVVERSGPSHMTIRANFPDRMTNVTVWLEAWEAPITFILSSAQDAPVDLIRAIPITWGMPPTVPVSP